MLALMPSLVRTRRAAIEAYQAAHSRGAERTLCGGRSYVASFVKAAPERIEGRSKKLFMGLYRNMGHEMRSHAAIMAHREVHWLYESFGVFAEMSDASPERQHRWFDLQLDDHLSDYEGSLLVLARLTQNYVRLAENLDAPILALSETGAFEAAPPDWRQMHLSAEFVRNIPLGWAARLREWRGVYLIVDERDGARYVGSAYGAENLLGRWQEHVAGDRGITAGLAGRETRGFRFSILERLSPDMEANDVIRREHSWIARLDTIRYGLNLADQMGGVPRA
ncbi:GIY-YIG catalytic domain-containing protein [Litoreibacter ponti]|uniref:GIY-YIG catalytic domain-containing protein n=2 Tax=Litoreibacter ponti TaxID=1510457 RepID=A0A2T6BLH6_9RHOB|nr:GIY-YIG catalytic domain-containing protein [Litoreibacter ponti]